MTDFDKILRGLPSATRTAERVVTEAELAAKAKAMALRGYVHSRETLAALDAYLRGYGILLSGAVGIGKTLFFKTVNPEPIAILSFNTCHLWKYDQLDEFLRETRGEELVLDDIGWQTEANSYGTRYEALQVALDYRINASSARTHATTNCTNDELIDRFDGHLVDRLYECCQCFKLPPAQSRREAKPNTNFIRNIAYEKQMGKEVL